MRWPFGPPHLTLKPSQKKTQKNKKQKKQTKKQKKKEKVKEHKNTKKELFSYQSKFSFFWGGVQKLPFLTTWPRKRAPPKHYKNRGFSLFFEKKLCVTKRPFLDPKNPNPEIPVIIFLPSFSFNSQKTPKLAETPILIVF